MELGRIGLWTFALGSVDPAQLPDTLAEIESLGFGAVWFPGGRGEATFDLAEALLRNSGRLSVATGIVNIWGVGADAVATRSRSLWAQHGERFVLGLGVSHPEFVNRAAPGRYRRPVASMTEFLDDLDSIGDPEGGRRGRVLAALGPKMLQLSAERAAGAHPYFVPVEHTSGARSVLGHGALLAPELAVVLEKDPAVARRVARRYMSLYLQLSNYTENLRRLGFTEEDLSEPTDRLVDAIVSWGDEDTIAQRVREHHDAGADHVCVQVIPPDEAAAPSMPMDVLRRLAPALRGG